jgi:DivIVA domain-containing protein
MGPLLLVLLMVLVLATVVFGVVVLLSGEDAGLGAAEPDGVALPLPTNRSLAEDDLKTVRFDTALRGYRMAQVDRALRRTAYDVGYKDEMIAVLEAEVAALRDGRTEDAELLRKAREAAADTTPVGTPAPGLDFVDAGPSEAEDDPAEGGKSDLAGESDPGDLDQRGDAGESHSGGDGDTNGGGSGGDPNGGDSDGHPSAGDSRGGDSRGGDSRGGDSRGGDSRGGDSRGGDPNGGDSRGGGDLGGRPLLSYAVDKGDEPTNTATPDEDHDDGRQAGDQTVAGKASTIADNPGTEYAKDIDNGVAAKRPNRA